MSLRPSRLLGRIAAVSLLVVVLAPIIFGIALPIRNEYRRVNTDLESNRTMINRLAAISSEESENRQYLERVKASAESDGAYFKNSTETLAEAELRDRLNRAARAHGVSLRSTQSLSPQEFEGFRKISLRVAFDAELKGVVDFLYDLESSQPYLFIDDLEIRSTLRRASSEAPVETRSQSLSVRMDLFGLLVPGRRE